MPTTADTADFLSAEALAAEREAYSARPRTDARTETATFEEGDLPF